MSPHDVDRPRKRRRIDTISIDCVEDMAADIDLEIRINERIAKTIDSRIAWALILKESLEATELKSSGGAYPQFQAVALNALQAVEEPSRMLLDHHPPPALGRVLPDARTHNSAPLASKPSRPKFLYWNSPEGLTCILRCPECARSSFTTLQGLLNHGRSTHKFEWLTHEDCIQACAVPHEELDVSVGIEVGGGTAGVRPALQSIFKMAVEERQIREASEQGSHISRTLGIHDETPALAPFLGKEVQKRDINIWGEEENVDIDTMGMPTLPLHKWERPHNKRVERNVASSLADSVPEGYAPLQSLSNVTPSVGEPQDSRFHFTTRVVVCDWSKFIFEEQRHQFDGHTHKWMVSVEAPSYSRDITTVLESVTVSNAWEPASFEARTSTGPPFVVVGTASKPFLASVILTFCPSRREVQTHELEHWVRLPTSRTQYVTQGEEQIIDIDLDKTTVLRPSMRNTSCRNHRALWDDDELFGASCNHDATAAEQALLAATEGDQESESYELVLESLLPRFPLTMQDFKPTALGRKARAMNRRPHVPYMVVDDLEAFSQMVMGRQQAIQWGRAKALKDEYMKQTSNAEAASTVPLTTADVLVWLRDGNPFVRDTAAPEALNTPSTPQVVAVDAQDSVPSWCAFCGMQSLAHQLYESRPDPDSLESMVKAAATSTAGASSAKESGCPIVPVSHQMTQMPIFNVMPVLRTVIPPPATKPDVTHHLDMEPHDILAVANPALTVAIQSIIGSIALPHFPPASDRFASLEDMASLAPCAILALALRSFICALVQGGLDVNFRHLEALKNKCVALGARKAGRRATSAVPDVGERLLTPSQIIRGVVLRGWDTNVETSSTAIFCCLARVGISATSASPAGLGQQDVESVKQEIT